MMEKAGIEQASLLRQVLRLSAPNWRLLRSLVEALLSELEALLRMGGFLLRKGGFLLVMESLISAR